ncbi:MAG: DUF1329 domain-containing protein, partial [Candidatus Binataceae bacterium]
MGNSVSRFLLIAAVSLALAWPTFARAQTSTDFSELTQYLKEPQSPTPPPVGTKITMANWQQYKAFLPFGMTKLFEGQYQWKMPADVEIDIGPTHIGGNLPKTFIAATEKYAGQNEVEVLPNGHYVLKNYHGGIPFPNPADPHKGWKLLANVFFAYVPAIITSTPHNKGIIWFNDRFNNISADTFSLVYRQ